MDMPPVLDADYEKKQIQVKVYDSYLIYNFILSTEIVLMNLFSLLATSENCLIVNFILLYLFNKLKIVENFTKYPNTWNITNIQKIKE